MISPRFLVNQPSQNGEGIPIRLLSRVIRGGGWNNNGDRLRAANRNRRDADNRNNNVGFRVVRVPPCWHTRGEQRDPADEEPSGRVSSPVKGISCEALERAPPNLARPFE